MWTCTLLQHRNSGNVGVLMDVYFRMQTVFWDHYKIILDLQNHPFPTGRRQSSSNIPEKLCSAGSSRSDMNPDQTADLGFTGVLDDVYLPAPTPGCNHPYEILNEGKLDLFVYHMMCHMMQEEDLQLRKLEGVPGRRDVCCDWKLNDQPLNYYIKPLTTKQLLIIWVAAERMVNEAFSTFSFSTHAEIPPRELVSVRSQWRAA